MPQSSNNTVAKVTAGGYLDIPSRSEFTDWIQEIEPDLSSMYLAGLAYLSKSSLRFLVLTCDKIIEKTFYADRFDASLTRFDASSSSSPPAKKEITLFYDRPSRTAFILSPVRKPVEEALDAGQPYLLRAKTVSGLYQKPPLNSENVKGAKGAGGEVQMNSASTLDTVNTINTLGTSLNDLEGRGQTKAPTSRTQLSRKNTVLNVYTTSLNDASNHFNYPDSAVLQPTTDKFIVPSPHSASKHFGYFRGKDVEQDEQMLVPKDKEPVPLRFNMHGIHREASSMSGDGGFAFLSEKSRNDIAELTRQNSFPFSDNNLSQKPEKTALLERSSTQYLADIKPKGDYLSKTYSDYARPDYGIKLENDFTLPTKTTVSLIHLPISYYYLSLHELIPN